jgi:hypothetical protein
LCAKTINARANPAAVFGLYLTWRRQGAFGQLGQRLNEAWFGAQSRGAQVEWQLQPSGQLSVLYVKFVVFV